MNWQNYLGNMSGILFTKGVALFRISPLKAMVTANSLSSVNFVNTLPPTNIITHSITDARFHPAIVQKSRVEGFFQSLSQILFPTYFTKQFAEFFSKNSVGCPKQKAIVSTLVSLLLNSKYTNANSYCKGWVLYNNILM